MSKQAIKKKFFSVFNYFERRQLLYQRTILTLPLGTHVVHAFAMLEIKRHSEKSQTKETVFFKWCEPFVCLVPARPCSPTRRFAIERTIQQKELKCVLHKCYQSIKTYFFSQDLNIEITWRSTKMIIIAVNSDSSIYVSKTFFNLKIGVAVG